MRTVTLAERNLLKSAHVNYHTSIEVEDGDGALVSLTNYGPNNLNFFLSGSIEMGVDDAVWSGSSSFKREHQPDYSLAPFMETSPLNVYSGGYAPLLDMARRIVIKTAATANGIAPVAGDWKTVFDGIVDAVDSRNDPIVVAARDKYQWLLDTIIEYERVYGDSAGVAVETVMQAILDDNLGPGFATLVLPGGSPGWLIREFKQDRVAVFEAVRRLAEQIGHTVHGRWSDATTYQLQFYEPNRLNVTPDATFDKDEYFDVTGLEASKDDIRNVCTVGYVEAGTQVLSTQTYEDPQSVLKFGRRYMEIQEGSQSNIDTAIEALAMATAAVRDLSYPLADHSIEMSYFWPAELGDLYEFMPNNVHYSSIQKFACVRIVHTWSEEGDISTTVDCRGTPAGGYVSWLAKEGRGPKGTSAAPKVRIINVLYGEADAYNDTLGDGQMYVQLEMPRDTEKVLVYALEAAAASADAVPNPEQTANRLALEVRRPEGKVSQVDKWWTGFHLPSTATYYRKVTLVPVGYGGRRGDAVTMVRKVEDTPNVFALISLPGDNLPVTLTRLGSSVIIDYHPNPPLFDGGDARYDVIITRDGQWVKVHVLDISDLGAPYQFIDEDLYPDKVYTYRIFQLCENGQTGAMLEMISLPNPTLITAINNTPDGDFSTGAPRVRLDWNAAVPGGITTVIEKSVDAGVVQPWAQVHSAAYAVADTWLDADYTQSYHIRIRVLDGVGSELACSATYFWPGFGSGALP